MIHLQTSFKNNVLSINISGHLDTAACTEVRQAAEQWIANYPSATPTCIQLENLDFISSTGLRIILQLKKHFTDLSIVDVCPDVYTVFEMTGFTQMMHIEKALRRISIENCPEIGRGGVGIVYRLTDDSIIKVFREGTCRDDVDKEIGMAKEAFILGMPTAISYDVVRVGSSYGLVYEMLNAQTLSAVIVNEPEHLDDYAIQFARLYKKMHAIEVPQHSSIPDAYEHEMLALDKIRHYLSNDIVDKAKRIMQSIPQGNSLLHCDLHPKNVMLQGDELMFIDMGEVSKGSPIIDLGHTTSSMKYLTGDYEGILGMSEAQAHRFYQVMIDEYYKDITPEEKTRNIELLNKMSIVRGISWLALSDNFPQDLVNQARDNFLKRIS